MSGAHRTSGDSRIVVVGAGPAGLVLARVLAEGGADVTVLERDAGPDARRQGGSLDLHPESGQRALVTAGLIEEFHRYARPQGDEIRILDPAGREHLRHGGSDPGDMVPDEAGVLPGRPEIDRAQLRSVLLGSLPDGVVRWGSHVASAVPAGEKGDRAYEVRLEDGSVVAADVLVGADGGRSRVRPLLTDVQPTPLGVTIGTVWVRQLSARPDLVELIGSGSLWGLGDGMFCGAQRGGDDDARVNVHVQGDGGTGFGPGTTKADLLARLDGWADCFHELVRAAGDEVDVYDLFTLPVDLTWPERSGLTVIGDAAHLMPPVGEGANQAMLDGAELGAALLARPDDPAAAVADFERAMWQRVRPVAEQSARIDAVLHSPGALETMVGFFGG